MKISNIDEYIDSFPIDKANKLNEMRKIIKNVLPDDVVETISWRMPVFRLNGDIVFFAGFKNHIGLYPMPEVIVEFKEELKGYDTTKGSIHFAYDKPLPVTLIEKIVRYRLAENLKKNER